MIQQLAVLLAELYGAVKRNGPWADSSKAILACTSGRDLITVTRSHLRL